MTSPTTVRTPAGPVEGSASAPPAVPRRRVLGLLVSRTVGFAICQAGIAVVYAVAGDPDPWGRSVPWWPLTAAATSVATGLLLRWALHREGARYRDLFVVSARTLRSDLGVTLLVGLVVTVVAILPTWLLGVALYGDPMVPVDLMFQPLPTWAAALASWRSRWGSA